MLTDIEIAQQTEMKPIADIAADLGVQGDELEPYGRYKAKLNEALFRRVGAQPNGKLILVTAINPTPAGEGKTTTTIGLGEAMARIGKKAVIALREPSLGPCVRHQGGAAGGGYAQVVPMEDINLHFTGDMHAITSANNLLCAMLDNHLQPGNTSGIDPRRVLIKRCLDMNDRALRNIVVGLGGKVNGVPREDGFVITVATEVMAILCLADSLADLKQRLGNILVAYTYDNRPVFARDLQRRAPWRPFCATPSSRTLCRRWKTRLPSCTAVPFANIAHGCNSVRATKLALKLGDYCITEAGFGSDLGAEKFLDIKCRLAGLAPDCIVVVATVRRAQVQRRRGQGGSCRRECGGPGARHCEPAGPCGQHAQIRRARRRGDQPLPHGHRGGNPRDRRLLPRARRALCALRSLCKGRGRGLCRLPKRLCPRLTARRESAILRLFMRTTHRGGKD